MTTRKHPPLRRFPIARVPIPRTRDPFVNTPLLSLGTDRQGIESFWISTWNANVGCLGVKVNEMGDCRVYRFPDPRFGGFYSAAPENERILWLWGWLDEVVRLDLSTGRWRTFSTGAPRALVFAGMARDPHTGKLFAAAFAPPQIEAVVFDPATGRTVKRFSAFSRQHYLRASFPNGDGSHTVFLQCPGLDLVRWDPRDDSLRVRTLQKTIDPEAAGPSIERRITDDNGRQYLPGHGWFNPRSWDFETSGPRPSKEMAWFGRRGNLAYGCASQQNDNAAIWEWNLETGGMREICKIPDTSHFNLGLTRSGKVVDVNLYGVFHRLDAATGALECCRPLPTDSIGQVDCLVRIDRDRLLGTPFITQRFWEANRRTKQGFDCGRAAPGCGEVLQTWKIGGKIYLAAYGGGELLEYDPRQPPHFPENPRVVADPPGGMRPVAAADDGRHIFYACSRHYGLLGSVLARHDTRTGETRCCPDPLPDQKVVSLQYDRATNRLVFGTSMDADCQSRPPTSDECYFGLIDANDLRVYTRVPAPKDTVCALLYGSMGDGRCLCACHGDFPEGIPWFGLDVRMPRVPERSAMRFLAKEILGMRSAGRPGYFVQHIGKRIELWDMRAEPARVGILARRFNGYGFFVQEDSVYLATRRAILVLDGCLKGLR